MSCHLDTKNQNIQSDEERLTRILEEGHYGFWEMNIQSGDIILDSKWFEIFEYDPDEITPTFETQKKFIHPSDLPLVLSKINEHLQGDSPRYEAEYRIRNKSGIWKWILVRGQVNSWDEKGYPLHMTGSVLDIDQRKQTELALIESEQRYRAIVNDQSELICRFLADGTLIFVNDAYCRYFNKTQEELLGHSFMPLIPEEDQEAIQQNIAGICMDKPLANYDHRVILPSGEVRWQNWTDRAIFDQQGNFVECQSVGRDITVQKEAEEALRWSEECFRKIFDTSKNLISIVSLEDNTLINVNETWVKYIGYTREEAVGHTGKDLNIIVNEAEFNKLMGVLLDNGHVDNFESGYRTKSNEIRLAKWSAKLMDIGGKPCRLVMIDDITEHRRLEKQMGRLDQLRLVGQMAASIAHEIRNPLTTVRGFLQLFGEQKHYAEDSENIDLMIEEIDRANQIISEYLSLASNRVANLAPESINDILIALKPLLLAEAVMSDKSVMLELDPIPDLLLNNKEMRQIILNITRNAMEATPVGGRITLRTFTEGDEVVLSVEDQGHGIRDEYLEKMGVPFFTTKENGTGLGLAVCYGIAIRHNAIIDIKTGSNGTTFFIRFKASISC